MGNLFTVRELAVYIGKKPQYINTYKSRGKIIVSDGKIDIENPINKMWVDPLRKKYIDDLSSGKPMPDTNPKTPKSTVKTEQQTTNPVDTEKKQRGPGRPDKENNIPPDKLTEMELEKKEAELRKKKADAAKAELELERMKGKLLDMDTAKAIIGAYMRTFSNGLFRDIETHMTTVLDIYKVSLNEKTSHISKLDGLINNASDRAMNEMRKVLESDELKVSKK